MNLRQLEILRAIVRYNTTVATGRALGLSQPAISNALKTMEEQVGFALFQRVNNRIYPTAETKILLEEAEAIFDIHKRLETKISDLRNTRSGQLRVVATPPLGYGVIAQSIRGMQIRRPQVRTLFDTKRYEEVLESIEMHQAELGFVMGSVDQPGLNSEIMFEGEMICVMKADSPLTELKVVTPRDLARQRFIALEGGTKLGEALRAAFEESRQKFHFSVEVRYGLTACVLADADVGVAVVDPLTAQSASRFSLVYRPFRPRIPVSASVVWAENRSLTRIARIFLEEVRARIPS